MACASCGSTPHAIQKVRQNLRRRDGLVHPTWRPVDLPTRWAVAQDFASRYPLVDGRAISAISTAITPPATLYRSPHDRGRALLLEGIDETVSNLAPNYDGQSKEPIVLPGGFPNLLANGSQGIAVGHGDLDPRRHNAAETLRCRACI